MENAIVKTYLTASIVIFASCLFATRVCGVVRPNPRAEKEREEKATNETQRLVEHQASELENFNKEKQRIFLERIITEDSFVANRGYVFDLLENLVDRGFFDKDHGDEIKYTVTSLRETEKALIEEKRSKLVFLVSDAFDFSKT